jgi:Amt family ammonium transporter
LAIQGLAIFVTIVYTFVITYILFKVVDKFFGLRVSENDELVGLDLNQHEETGYEF